MPGRSCFDPLQTRVLAGQYRDLPVFARLDGSRLTGFHGKSSSGVGEGSYPSVMIMSRLEARDDTG